MIFYKHANPPDLAERSCDCNFFRPSGYGGAHDRNICRFSVDIRVCKNAKALYKKNNPKYQNGNLFITFVPIIEKSMRVIAKKILRVYWEKQTDSEEQLKTWYKEASKAAWTSPNEIKAGYPRASILKNGRVVFNICGNKYRLIVQINYLRQWVFIRFIGTHGDYDRIDADKI